MTLLTAAKRFAKRTIGYPEQTVDVISVKDWITDLSKDPMQDAVQYVKDLFPVFSWISRYNLNWFYGDVVAGITVGMVLVPQSMSYAKVATLPPQYGLYSSFIGVLIYFLFGTSKDVSIGPVAVMSLSVAEIIRYVNEKHPKTWTSPEIGTQLALVAGLIVLSIGLLRLGWIIDFISVPAVTGFVTGSAISIAVGQFPGLLGITGFNTRAASFDVFINTLKHLNRTKLDAAWGLPALVALYVIRDGCDFLARRFPKRSRLFFFISVMRNAIVIIVLTVVSWLYTRHRKDSKGNYPIHILGNIPRGLKRVEVPKVDSKLLKTFAPKLPAAIIVLFLEHIAIAKSFGRLNGYKINPNQELISIGLTNTLGAFFHAYPSTGSFSRSALQAKSGVRTPAAGILTSFVVIVALYGLTFAFKWIPSAVLNAVIIHAVIGLIASPKEAYSYWRSSPPEFIFFVIEVIITIFSTVENGIYAAVAFSLILLLVRVARPRGKFLGKVKIQGNSQSPNSVRETFAPLNTGKGPARGILYNATPPRPGVIIYRFEDSYLYPNANLATGDLVEYVKEHMRRGKDVSQINAGDRPWNDPGPGKKSGEEAQAENLRKPLLRAIVLDLSVASHLDTTAVHQLNDTRSEIERWTDHSVEFHFASILSPWARRALVSGGFGVGIPASQRPVVRNRSTATIVGDMSDSDVSDIDMKGNPPKDEPTYLPRSPSFAVSISSASTDIEAMAGSEFVHLETPFFHFDLTEAVNSAEDGLDWLSRI